VGLAMDSIEVLKGLARPLRHSHEMSGSCSAPFGGGSVPLGLPRKESWPRRGSRHSCSYLLCRAPWPDPIERDSTVPLGWSAAAAACTLLQDGYTLSDYGAPMLTVSFEGIPLFGVSGRGTGDDMMTVSGHRQVCGSKTDTPARSSGCNVRLGSVGDSRDHFGPTRCSERSTMPARNGRPGCG
jgi:hypothetical protein